MRASVASGAVLPKTGAALAKKARPFTTIRA